MYLCSLNSVKRMLGIEVEQTVDDDVLNTIIAGVSAQIEQYLNRTAATGTYTEYFDVLDGASRFAVRAYPVTAVTSITNAADGQWASGSSIGASYINFSNPNGIISIYASVLVAGADALRIIYTGGMAADAESLEGGDYADVALACTAQCIAVWNKRRYFGVSSAGVGGQSVAPTSATGFEPEVEKMLVPHRRLVLA